LDILPTTLQLGSEGILGTLLVGLLLGDVLSTLGLQGTGEGFLCLLLLLCPEHGSLTRCLLLHLGLGVTRRPGCLSGVQTTLRPQLGGDPGNIPLGLVPQGHLSNGRSLPTGTSHEHLRKLILSAPDTGFT
jgi:hypothetical protein